MRSMASLGCGCCECDDCCNGQWPDEFDVELSFFTGADCDECGDTIGGIYTLQKLNGEYGPCEWQYSSLGPGDGYCDPGCTSPYVESQCPTIDQVFIRLKIRCISATKYQISVEAFFDGGFFPGSASYCGAADGDRASYLNQYTWVGEVTRPGNECVGLAGVALPYYGRQCWCGPWGGATIHTCRSGAQFWVCTESPPPSDAVVNAA